MRILAVVHPDDRVVAEALRARGAEVGETLFVRPGAAAEIAAGGWDAVVVSEFVPCEDISLEEFLSDLALRSRARIKLILDARRPSDPLIRKAAGWGIYEILNQAEFTADELWELVSSTRTLADIAHLLGPGPEDLPAPGSAPAEGDSPDKDVQTEPDRGPHGLLRSILGFAGRRETAPSDRLTGLPTREAGEMALAEALSAGGAAAVFVDLDRFKEVNDTRGHAEGDRVLREAARAMRRAVRGEDLLCRWGGDEFVLVMPGSDLITAQEAAERLREAVAGIIGASVGVAVSRPGDGPGDLIDRADRAMYEDKRARKATQDAADDPWPVFRPSELPTVPTLTRREVTTDWVRVARGGMAVIGATVSLVRLAVWLGALAFLGLLGLRLLAMWNEMSIIWRGMLR